MKRLSILVLALFVSPAFGIVFRQNEPVDARRDLFVEMVDSVDLYTPKTGLTLTVEMVKAGGAAYAAIAGSAVEIGAGTYKVSLAAADLDTIGQAMLKVTATGAAPQKIPVEVQVFDANLTQIDGLPTCEPAATLNLAHLNVSAQYGDSEPAVSFRGNTSPGLNVVGSNAAMVVRGQGAQGPAMGLSIIGETEAEGVKIVGGQGAVGMLVQAGTGGSLDQAGIRVEGTDNNAPGIQALGHGTGKGLEASLSDARLANLDAAVTSRAPAATALSNATWSDAKAALLDATISSRLAAAAYTPPTIPPTPAENAAAVWDEALANHATAGSAGAKLSSLQPGGDATAANQQIILNRLGSFTGTGTDTVLGYLRALASKAADLTPAALAAIGFDNGMDSLEAIRDTLRGIAITVTSPVASNGSISIVQGDDYTGAAALVLTRTWAGLDLTGATATFAAIPQTDYEQGNRPASLGPLPCTIATNAGTVTVAVNLTAAQTAALGSSPPKRRYGYWYEVEAMTAGGLKQTLFLGQLNVTQQVAK